MKIQKSSRASMGRGRNKTGARPPLRRRSDTKPRAQLPRVPQAPEAPRQSPAKLPADSVSAAPRTLDTAASAPSPATNLFPIVGIGASAGGLEALEEFLRHVPVHCGMAFVVVQHLDPTHKGAVVELLQRTTAMSVSEVRDGQRVEPDHVYVIPPNKDMSILHGVGRPIHDPQVVDIGLIGSTARNSPEQPVTDIVNAVLQQLPAMRDELLAERLPVY